MADTQEYQLDLDAFAPPVGKSVKFQGTVYHVPDMADIPAEDLLLILRSEENFRGKGPTEQLEMGLQYIRILIPSMRREALDKLTQRQMLAIMGAALGAANLPPMGDDRRSGSDINSPSSPASTAGPGANSGA